MIFLRKSDVLAMHARAIREHGGASGLRDEAALESAIVAAENRRAYEGAGLAECASAYAYHLTLAHAFVDGNKRVGAIAGVAFVFANGGELDTDDDELAAMIFAIAAGSVQRDAVDEWFRRRVHEPPEDT